MMLALAAEQVEAAQEEDKENQPPATPAPRGPKWLRDPQAGPLRVCSKPFTLSCNCI